MNMVTAFIIHENYSLQLILLALAPANKQKKFRKWNDHQRMMKTRKKMKKRSPIGSKLANIEESIEMNAHKLTA